MFRQSASTNPAFIQFTAAKRWVYVRLLVETAETQVFDEALSRGKFIFRFRLRFSREKSHLSTLEVASALKVAAAKCANSLKLNPKISLEEA